MNKKQILDPHTADLIDHYWGSINNLTGLVKASELKAGLILSFYGILLNLIYQSIAPAIDVTRCDALMYILIAAWIIAATLSVFYCVRCFIPKMEASYDDNVFFFGDVITKFGSIKDFAKTFYEISLDKDRLFLQMGEQIFILSKIANWKFKNVKKSIKYLAVSLVVLFLAAVYYGVLSI